MTLNDRPQLAIRVLLWLGIVLVTVSHASASWKEKVLYSFQGGTDGQLPAGGVVFDKSGNVYGATTQGGADNCAPIANCGTVFELSPSGKEGAPWTETVLYVFKGKVYNDGDSPTSGLLLDTAGNLFGVTAYGGTGDCVLLGTKAGCGTVFELSPPAQKGGAWTETILYSFKSGKDGYFPQGDLTFDAKGNLYGATLFGGGKGTTCNPYYQYCGTVFELNPPKQKGAPWMEKVLHSFGGGQDGAVPNGGLILDSKGAIYGTTYWGGSKTCQGGPGCGTAFELKPAKRSGGARTENILHRFTGSDGAGPTGGLVFDAKGSLYGTAQGGGRAEDGVVFRLAISHGKWTEAVLYDFPTNTAGRNPATGLTFDAAGDLYGSASSGAHARGVLFRLRPEVGGGWVFSDIYSFTGPPDGAGPEARLTFDAAGNLYSTTVGGGSGNGDGTVFEVSP